MIPVEPNVLKYYNVELGWYLHLMLKHPLGEFHFVCSFGERECVEKATADRGDTEREGRERERRWQQQGVLWRGVAETAREGPTAGAGAGAAAVVGMYLTGRM